MPKKKETKKRKVTELDAFKGKRHTLQSDTDRKKENTVVCEEKSGHE